MFTKKFKSNNHAPGIFLLIFAVIIALRILMMMLWGNKYTFLEWPNLKMWLMFSLCAALYLTDGFRLFYINFLLGCVFVLSMVALYIRVVTGDEMLWYKISIGILYPLGIFIIGHFLLWLPWRVIRTSIRCKPKT